MMRCLCCGKEISDTASADEKKTGWHRKCVRHFFGTNELPELELTDDALELLAEKNVSKEYTVPGVQKKMSLHLSREQKARLTLVDYPTGYILKPQTEEYRNLPEYEQMAMLMADECGVKTVPHALMFVDGRYAYITRRVDREVTGRVQLYAMEDFCQLSGRLTADKYKGSYEGCGRIIKKYSALTGFDLSELFLRLVFSFAIGNSDMHLKNFSLIEDRPASRVFHLSPAYDMLPVNVILPADREQMALTLNGKKRNLHRNDFLKLADHYDIPRKAAESIIDSVLKRKDRLFEICGESYLGDEQKTKLTDLLSERLSALGKQR